MKKIKKKNPEMAIFKYIKDNKGRIKGLMVGFSVPNNCGKNRFAVGYSLCNPKDSFDMETAVNLCYRRGTGYLSERIPQSIRKDLSCFADRCRSYFQGKMLVSRFSTQDFSFLEFFKILPEDFKKRWFDGDQYKPKEIDSNPSVFYCKEFTANMNTVEFPFRPSQHKVISQDFEFKNCTQEKPIGSYIKIIIEHVA